MSYGVTRAAFFLVLLAAACTERPAAPGPGPPVLPVFFPAVRAYHGADHDEFQFGSMRELGLEYVHGLPSFTWENIEPRDDDRKWNWIEGQMAAVGRAGARECAPVPGRARPR